MEKEKMVKIRMPISRNEKEAVFVAVNGRTFLIKRGEEVEVPDYVVQVINRSERMQELAMKFEDAASKPLEKMETGKLA